MGTETTVITILKLSIGEGETMLLCLKMSMGIGLRIESIFKSWLIIITSNYLLYPK
jgi:hypothetical protein